ncbi:hypothetical protein BHR43_13370 [Aeromonas salmonicida subsp. salmonicida]|nr:hypothetical protein NV17_09645 [Aeromonas salmonicida subsp. salmonicida]ORJ12802.1 hypothetical protein A7D02_10050 [Aeromonas salmonicida]KIX25439.1 hypothetical protein TM02_09285 [Aeromonas salmonicida subsp. salmonicida]KTA89854.1 hypothetical protein UC37_08640 [Aeromonas salmonicida subsp. salmonicida]KYN74131.1 hypothetical protein UC38_08000 [Aeromonas salmonicida subsp. salmonicida]
MKARQVGPKVTLFKHRILLETSGQKAAPQGGVRHQANAQRAAGWQHLGFDIPRPEGILRLHRRHRMHGMGAPQGGRADLAQADTGNLALLHQLRQPCHRLFNGVRRVDAMHIVEVYLLDPEPAQRGFTALPCILDAVVQSAPVLAALTHYAELGGDLDPGSVGRQEAADQGFIVVRAIHVGSVEKIDPHLDGPGQHPQRLLIIPRAIKFTHAHAAEAHGGYVQISAQCSSLHTFLLTRWRSVWSSEYDSGID